MDVISELRVNCLSSLMVFIKTFFELKTGKPFETPTPIGRRCHYEIMVEELEDIFCGKANRLIINVPPGHAKSTVLVYFTAWCYAHFPDCQFMYISYSYDLAEKHTATIKEIMQMPLYRQLFGVEICSDSKAKGNFKTTKGGRVGAYGSAGSITGMDAGLPYTDRFSGGVIIDDAHKPTEVHSDTIREGVIQNYNQTIKPRPRGPTVPIIFIGQRLHEGDLGGYLLEGRDGITWRAVVLKALDEAGNALCPSLNPLEMLLREQEVNAYVFASQYQQNPQPAGGGIFKPEWFYETDEVQIISTFITADTAETSKSYNDATVFSFWGIYKITMRGIDTGVYGLQWIDCKEGRFEPKDLESEFFDFYASCMRYPVKPMVAAIEKKSTGVTLASILNGIQGIRIINVERTSASGSKTARFFEAQPLVASKRISFPRGAKHIHMCVEHCRKITANDSHSHDDIADTMYDAIKLALIDGVLLPHQGAQVQNKIAQEMANKFNTIQTLRAQRKW